MLDFFVEEIGADRVEELLEMLRARAAWLEERGQAMWDLAKLEPAPFFANYPGARIFLCMLDDEKMGGFVLIDRDDRRWPGHEADKAYYLHKFVLLPEFSGRGFADEALGWAAGFAEAKGKDSLRLDYEEHRSGLAKLYSRCGFVPVQVDDLPDGTRLVLAERRVGRESGVRALP
jgi:GNAT superfamily N-acetyltransferase